MSLIEVEGLRAGFGMTQALAGVDLAFESGQLVAVVGPSGSGKSTLLNCLAGLHRPDSGAVFFDGRPLGRLSEKDRSALRLRAFGLVFQFGYLVPELTILENVALPVWLLGVGRKEARSRAGDLLDQLGIADVSDQLPAEVSGGQMQRAALAGHWCTALRSCSPTSPPGLWIRSTRRSYWTPCSSTPGPWGP